MSDLTTQFGQPSVPQSQATAGAETPEDATVNGQTSTHGDNQEIEQLKTQVYQLTGQMQNLVTLMQQGQQSQSTQSQSTQQPSAPDPQELTFGQDSAQQLEEMDRAQFGNELLKRVEKLVEGVSSKFDQKFQDLGYTMQKNSAQQEVEKLRQQDKSFDQWIPEVKETMRAEGLTSIRSAYELAKARNPEKAKKLAEPDNQPGTQEQKPEEQQPTMPSYQPGGVTAQPSEAMDFKQAAEHAWSEVGGIEETIAALDEW